MPGIVCREAGDNHCPGQSAEGDVELELILELAEMGRETALHTFYTFNKLSWL